MPIAADPTPDALARLAENESSGRSTVTIQRVYPLDEVPAALGDFAAGTLGKLVVDLGQGGG